MSTPLTVEPVFIGSCLNAIDTMKRAGMQDGLIAACLVEIRMAAIMEDRLRRQRLDQENPPLSPRPSEILRYFDETFKSSAKP